MTPQLILVPFDRLVASRANVRRVATDLAPLVASLRADGILQNLVVVPRAGGRYEVIAGERRRRAAAILVREGHWPKDRPIACEARSPADAVAISIAENVVRVAMHPADAYRAFAALEAQGHDATAIAHRYGYAPAEVARLLRLGTLNPKALKALADDRIDVAFAQALTLTDDHELQETVLRRAASATDARRMLTQSKVATSNRLYRFVTAEYAAAGGAVTGDLFGAEGYADDAELVQKLVSEKLERTADEARRAGWGEAIAAETEPCEAYRLERLAPEGERPMTIEEAEAVRVAQAEIAAREAAVAAEDRTADDRTHIAERRRAIGEIERGCRLFTDEQKAGGILVISIDYEGNLRTVPCRRDRSRADKDPVSPASRPLYPASLVEDLSKLRTRALQLEVMRNPALALHILIDALLGLQTAGATHHAVQLRAERFRLDVSDAASAAPVADPVEEGADLLATMPVPAAARWDWLVGLPADAKARLAAFATARLLNGTAGKFADTDRLASFERLARAAGLDMAATWSGGPEFFARLTRRACLKALEEGVSREAAENCARLGKAELASACAERLKGTGWLPEPLRLAPAADGDASGAGPHGPVLLGTRDTNADEAGVVDNSA